MGDVAMRNSTVRAFAGLITLVIAIAVPDAHAGGFVFTNFDGAGDHTNGTTVNGINNNGDIVGFSTGATGNLTNWIRNPDGSFTLLTPPLGTADMANGINNAKTVVGVTGANAFSLPFGGSSVTLLPAANPGHTGNELAFGINDHGVIVGQYVDTSTTPSTTPGFILNGTTFTILRPVAPVNGVLVVNAQGINNNGLVTGFYTTNNTTPPVDGNEPQHGFFYDSTTKTFTLPADPNKPNFFTVQLLSVNDRGIAVGYWQDTAGNQHGLLYNFNTGTYGFVDDPTVGTIGGLVTTQITGINAADTQITGFYSDASTGTFRGFVASIPEPGSLALMGIGLTLAAGFVARRSGAAGRSKS
jgi:hypothetical protein